MTAGISFVALSLEFETLMTYLLATLLGSASLD